VPHFLFSLDEGQNDVFDNADFCLKGLLRRHGSGNPRQLPVSETKASKTWRRDSPKVVGDLLEFMGVYVDICVYIYS
jgi:hypothetical protein